MIAPTIIVSILFFVMAGEYYAHKTGVPTVTSFPTARRKIVALLEKYLEPCAGENPYTIVDLGSGKGQLCRSIARAMPHAHVVGIELSPLAWLYSAVVRRLFGPANLEFKRLDFWTYDCSRVDAVVIFLTGAGILERVGEKLRRELKPGALVIANDERPGIDWEPIEIVDNPLLGIFHYSKIYVYRQ